jgi:hypothetical protein
MRLTLIIVSILFNTLIYGQSNSISLPELDTLYFKTIQSQMFFIQNATFYVEINETTKRLKNIEELNYLKFMSNEELIKESLETKRNLNVIRVTHKIISQDTIDINIGYLDVKAKRALHFNRGLKFVKADFKLSCGGTNGYIPTGRFIYNSSNNKWNQIENE